MFWDFFSQAYKLPLIVLKRAMANPMGIFVYGIMSKWYIMVMIATITVTFWVFKGLEKAGVLDAMQKEVSYGFLQAQAVAQNCVPLIVDLPRMWDCIQQTSGDKYVPNDDEKSLRNALEHDLQDPASMPNTTPSDSVAPNPSAPSTQYHPDDADNSSSSQSSNPYDNDPHTTTYDDGIIRANP